MKTLQAFHNKKSEKAFYVKRLLEHRRLEHLVQGVGWESNGGVRACNIGCLFEKYDHTLGPKLIGAPEWLMRLCDHLFEHLPPKDANIFAIDWVKAIPVGADLEPVRHKLAIWRCEQSIVRIKGNKEPYAIECRNAIQMVIAYHGGAIMGNDSSAAESAAESAAWSAARSAAWSAAESAAESAARSDYYKSEARELIKLLKKA